LEAAVFSSIFSISLTDAPLSSTSNELTGGTITVREGFTGPVLFQSSVATGDWGCGLLGCSVAGTLEPSATVLGGSFFINFGDDLPEGFSFASVTAITTPEPSALEGLLLGTGLLGLVDMARRKLQLGT
jgi:hypothetical protein